MVDVVVAPYGHKPRAKSDEADASLEATAEPQPMSLVVERLQLIAYGAADAGIDRPIEEMKRAARR